MLCRLQVAAVSRGRPDAEGTDDEPEGHLLIRCPADRLREGSGTIHVAHVLSSVHSHLFAICHPIYNHMQLFFSNITLHFLIVSRHN